MQMLFYAEFSHNNNTQQFTVFQLSENLFQAKSSKEIVMLWKIKNNWEGVTNTDESDFLEYIGAAIDNHFSTLKTS